MGDESDSCSIARDSYLLSHSYDKYSTNLMSFLLEMLVTNVQGPTFLDCEIFISDTNRRPGTM